MRRIRKSHTSNVLTKYAEKNPNGTWVVFQQEHGKAYKAIKDKLFEEQSEICAYCEIDLSKDNTYDHLRRVEHFKSKSGWKIGNEQPNWHLDWFNLLGVCIGGTDKDDRERFIMPDNKSCDAHKEHLETNLGYNKNWLGKVVSPLESELSSEMFNYCKASGELGVNIEHANSVRFEHNDYETSAELLQKSLELFNLNCERLKLARREIHHVYERIKAVYRKTGDVSMFTFKLKMWCCSDQVRSFQTTRDILLRECSVARNCLGSCP